MIRKAGGDAKISAEHSDLRQAKAIVLPGVGAFDNGMRKLDDLGLIPLLSELIIEKKVVFLGICLGMQLLFEKSEEGMLPGLGFIKGHVSKFKFPVGGKLKVPHMGWNVVHPISSSGLYESLENESRFYFVHSYFVHCDEIENVMARAFYGNEFTCSVRSGNVYGAQFHPEKSHKFGLTFFKNFLEIIC